MFRRRSGVSSMLGAIIAIIVGLALFGAIVYFGVNIFNSAYQTQQETNFLRMKDAEYLSLAVNGSNLVIKNGGQYATKVTQIMVIPTNGSPSFAPSGAPTFLSEGVPLQPGQSYNFSDLLQYPNQYEVITMYGNQWVVPFDIANPVNEEYALTIKAESPGSSIGVGGTTTPAPGTYYYSYGTPVTVSASAPDQYFTWGGWQGQGQYSYTGMNQTITIYTWGDITETAIFDPVYVTVTFSANGLGSDATGTVLTVDGASYTASQLPVSFTWQEGTTHTFSWSSPVSSSTSGKRYMWQSTSGLSSAQSGSLLVTGGGNVVANYGIQYYLNVYVASGSGSVSGSGWYDAGSTATATAYPSTGWHFADWTDGTTSNPISITMNGPVSIGANFAINYYDVTFTSSPAEGASVSYSYGSTSSSGTTPFSISVPYGSSVSYTYGSSFSGGAGVRYVNPNPSSGSQTITSDTTINAQYTTQYYLTMGVDPFDAGSVSPSSGWYNSGAQVAISETPNGHYIFEEWAGSGSGSYTGTSASATITMNGPISETAVYIDGGEIAFYAYDYGTNVLLTSGSVTVYGPAAYHATDYTITSSSSIWVYPGTYTVESFQNDQYGLGLYSTSTNVGSTFTVQSGRLASIYATYYTPTQITGSITQPGYQELLISGSLLTADSAQQGLGGMSLKLLIKAETDDGVWYHSTQYVTTNSSGGYSYLLNLDNFNSHAQYQYVKIIVAFDGYDGYYSSRGVFTWGTRT